MTFCNNAYFQQWCLYGMCHFFRRRRRCRICYYCWCAIHLHVSPPDFSYLLVVPLHWVRGHTHMFPLVHPNYSPSLSLPSSLSLYLSLVGHSRVVRDGWTYPAATRSSWKFLPNFSHSTVKLAHRSFSGWIIEAASWWCKWYSAKHEHTQIHTVCNGN